MHTAARISPVNLIKDMHVPHPFHSQPALSSSKSACFIFLFVLSSCGCVAFSTLSLFLSLPLKCVPSCLLCILHLFILFYMCCHAGMWSYRNGGIGSHPLNSVAFANCLEWQKWAPLLIFLGFVLCSLIYKKKTYFK